LFSHDFRAFFSQKSFEYWMISGHQVAEIWPNK